MGGKTLRNRMAVRRVAVPDEVVRRFVPGEGIGDLAGDPLRRRIGRHGERYQPPALVPEDDQPSKRTYCFRHQRRWLISLTMTSNPTAEWIARQITDALPWNEAPDHTIGTATRRTAAPSPGVLPPWAYVITRQLRGHPGRMGMRRD